MVDIGIDVRAQVVDIGTEVRLRSTVGNLSSHGHAVKVPKLTAISSCKPHVDAWRHLDVVVEICRVAVWLVSNGKHVKREKVGRCGES